MNLEFLSAELRELIEMALVTHEEFCGAGRFWECSSCRQERDLLVRSIEMEAAIHAVKVSA